MDLAERIDQETPVEEEYKGFAIEDEGSAIWAVRKIRAAKAKIAEHEEAANKTLTALRAEIQQVEDWLAQMKEEKQRTINFFETHLTNYLQKQQQEDKKLKSIKLPGAVIKSRKVAAKLSYNDDALIAFAQEKLPELVTPKTTYSVDRNELKNRITIDGFKVLLGEEEVQGITIVEPAGVKYSVEVL